MKGIVAEVNLPSPNIGFEFTVNVDLGDKFDDFAQNLLDSSCDILLFDVGYNKLYTEFCILWGMSPPVKMKTVLQGTNDRQFDAINLNKSLKETASI